MTQKNKGHFSQKHPGDVLNEKIAQKIHAQSPDGGLPCAGAFRIAADLSVVPGEVGRNADLLEIRIVQCQLGLFGYTPQRKVIKPAESIEPGLEKQLRNKLEDGCISCATIFSLAEKFNMPKMMISSACEKMGIRIISCQLGAF